MTEGVDRDRADRMRRFDLDLDDFCLEPKNILIQFGHIVSVKHVHIPRQQNTFADTQQVDSLRHIAVPNAHQTAGRAARNVFQSASESFFYMLGNCHEFL